MLSTLHLNMRNARAMGLTVALLAGGAGAAFAQTPPKASVSIEFLSDGRCTVKGEGQGFHANMTYTPKSAGDPSELRCAMPPLPSGRSVALTVVLPPGRRPSGSGAPTLGWSESEGRWRGTVSLADVPEVVVVEDWNSPRAMRGRVRTRATLVGASALAAFGVVAVLRRRRGSIAGS
jgi:hypothetical protein